MVWWPEKGSRSEVNSAEGPRVDVAVFAVKSYHLLTGGTQSAAVLCLLLLPSGCAGIVPVKPLATRVKPMRLTRWPSCWPLLAIEGTPSIRDIHLHDWVKPCATAAAFSRALHSWQSVCRVQW